MTRLMSVVAAVGLCTLLAAPVAAQGLLPDHLKCYKVKDPLKLTGVVDLFSPQFGLEAGCRISKAILFCVPALKRVRQSSVPVLPVSGAPLTDDRICYRIRCPKTPLPERRVIDQFGERVLTRFGASLVCTPARKQPTEIDVFPDTNAEVTVESPLCGMETIALHGPTTVEVHLGDLADTDGNGREQVPTEMIQLSLTGMSPCLGPVNVMLRDPGMHPHRRTMGEIEEVANTQTGRLDLPPFAPTGMADSFFDVFFEVSVPSLGLTLHNHTPKHMQSRIHHKPPGPGETYENPDVIQLYDQNENPFPARIGSTRHVPNPTTTTTTTSTTTTTQPPRPCGFDGQMCAGDCPNVAEKCVSTAAACACIPATQVCGASCPGLCASPTEQCVGLASGCACIHPN